MPAYILIRLTERGDPAEPMNYLPGYPVAAFDRDQYGGKQVLPKFGQIIVTDATVGEINTTYCSEWERVVDWEFVGHNYVIDGHRLNVFTQRDLVSASGLNGLTRDKVETFLNNWGASVFSIAQNSVVFDALISDAISSDGFWGINLSGGLFSEVAYDQSTGIHTTRITYSSIPGATAEIVAARIVERGCVITANQPAQSRITFTCGRDLVFQAFKLDVKSRVDRTYARRKWRVTQAAIDAIIAAGGTITVTRDQMLDLWHSRLTD